MQAIFIKKVLPEDLESLREISIQTFCEAFASQNTEENLNKYLLENFSVAKLTDEMKNMDSEFYFVMENTKVIGYLKLNSGKAQTELKDEHALEIERIYVLKSHYGKNIGKLLLEKAIERGHEQRSAYVWLGVWEENKRAIRFYRKYGFEAFDTHIFHLGDDAQTDLLMKLELA